MGRLLGNRQHRVRVTCEQGAARVGDHVSLSLDETVILRGAVLAYLLPLAGLLLGALTGQFFGGESIALVGGGAGLIFAWALARLLARRYFAELHPVARLR